jgi:hypothetical protein
MPQNKVIEINIRELFDIGDDDPLLTCIREGCTDIEECSGNHPLAANPRWQVPNPDEDR